MAETSTAKKTNGQSKKPEMEVKRPDQKTEPGILSLEKRIQKVEELNITIEKWRKLSEARKQMKSFELGNDGLSATVVLKDAAGREFKTSNNLVVTTILSTVLSELDKSIAATEEQINFAA